MSARLETSLWLAQRVSAGVLAVAVTVHLLTIVYAVRGGITAAEILDRLRGHEGWLAFYATFAVAVAVHGPIGLRAVLRELTPVPVRLVDALALALAAGCLLGGVAMAVGLYGEAPT